jgi:uncharacterized damage-inducible protein DinB
LLERLLPTRLLSMTLDEVRQLFAYNAWANRQIFDAAAALPVEQYGRDLKSSHGGIHGTLAHIVWAEHLWLNRWLKKANPGVAQGKDLHTIAEVRARWEEIEAERGVFLAQLADAQLDETRTVKPSTGGEYQHTFGQMFRHAVDHSSYHRGQVVTMLRQVGVVPPVTGLIFFYRRG